MILFVKIIVCKLFEFEHENYSIDANQFSHEILISACQVTWWRPPIMTRETETRILGHCTILRCRLYFTISSGSWEGQITMLTCFDSTIFLIPSRLVTVTSPSTFKLKYQFNLISDISTWTTRTIEIFTSIIFWWIGCQIPLSDFSLWPGWTFSQKDPHLFWLPF